MKLCCSFGLSILFYSSLSGKGSGSDVHQLGPSGVLNESHMVDMCLKQPSWLEPNERVVGHLGPGCEHELKSIGFEFYLIGSE